MADDDQPVLVVIACDPRSSHRAFEAMRIGVGVVAGENTVTFVSTTGGVFVFPLPPGSVTGASGTVLLRPSE